MSSLEVDSITRQLSEATVELNKKLSYAGKGLKLDSEDDAKEIEREIRDFKELEILCLEGNTIGVDAAKAIARGLQNHPEFKRALWSDMFTGRMKTEIPPALQHLSDAMMTSGVRLVELDLSDNAFGPNGIKGVQDLLKSETCFTLEVLRLNNNGLGTFGGKILATCLDECYEASCKTGKPMGLKVFVSGRGRLENDGAKNLSVVFKKMGSLEHVAMPQNGIQYPGITELAGAFAHCQKLKHLNLNDNTFTVKGARAMAEALRQMKGLKVINFGDCLIRTDGALLLADSLKNGHSELQEIILCGNEIQKPGGIAIANSLVEKENLTKIELGANNFGDDGVEEIKEILEPLGDILDDLDDDEGSEIEEDEDAQESEDEEEDEEVEVVKTDLTNIVEDPNITVSSFLEQPSPEKLMKLGPSRAEKFAHHVESLSSVEEGVRTLMKICSVVSPDDGICQKAATDSADAVLSELLDSAHKKAHERQMNTTNEILVHLGLIKNEDKKKMAVNLVGTLIVLEHVCRQTYFPKPSRNVMQTFLSKPDPNLQRCGSAHHKLMQTLYQY